jgi:peptide/nickel transport system substrate-binding protein
MATDTGTSTNDNKTWAFTIRDGVTFQDGSPVTCEDVKYGVSRTYATSVITDGPTYAIPYLNIPTAKDGSSVYKGPYDTSKSNDTAAYDKAVTCSDDNKTITFNLKTPVPDFNQTLTLAAFGAVPKAADTGAKYDNTVVSDGPYQIDSYKKGSQLTLVRNDNWDKASDPLRPAYPDKIVVQFGVDPAVIDKRIEESNGDDAYAIMRESVQPQNLATIFNSPQYADRRWNEYDPYSIYVAINTKLVPNQLQRQAILAAWPRQTVLTIAGGKYAGDLADGVIKSNFAGYAPTNIWSTADGGAGLLGAAIPDNGDPAYAKQLIQKSGEKMPVLNYQYVTSPTNDKAVGAVVSALAKAGITVKPEPLEGGVYYGIILDPNKAGALMAAGWGPDWGNASTIIPPLFTPNGGFDVSLWNDPSFNKSVNEALVQSGQEQIDSWNALNAEAMNQGLAVPTRFSKTQRIAGTQVGGGYIWAPYGSWPYGDMWVNQS